jgi:PHD/YefM family antitoxin component YafN of YafNO toxin-antitoxin module
MPVVGIRQLARNASAIIHDVSKTRRPTVVTDRGKPVGVIYPFDEEDFEDYILANSPELAKRLERADRDIAEGKTLSLEELLSRFGVEDATSTSSRPDEARSA